MTKEQITGQLASLAKQRQEALEKLARIEGALDLGRYVLSLLTAPVATDFPRPVAAEGDDADSEATG